MKLNLYRCDVCKTEYKLRDDQNPHKLFIEYGNGELKVFDLCDDCLADIEYLLDHPSKFRKAVEIIFSQGAEKNGS